MFDTKNREPVIYAVYSPLGLLLSQTNMLIVAVEKNEPVNNYPSTVLRMTSIRVTTVLE